MYFVRFYEDWAAYRYGHDWQYHAPDSGHQSDELPAGYDVRGYHYRNFASCGGTDDGGSHRGRIWYCDYAVGRSGVT